MDQKDDSISTLSIVEEKIIQLAKSKENGTSNKEIQETVPDVPASEWTKIVNKLLKSG